MTRTERVARAISIPQALSDKHLPLFGMALTGDGGPLGFDYRTKVEIHDWDWVNAAFRLACSAAIKEALSSEGFTKSS